MMLSVYMQIMSPTHSTIMLSILYTLIMNTPSFIMMMAISIYTANHPPVSIGILAASI